MARHDAPEVTEGDLRLAEARMAERRRTTPRAVAAVYDRRIGRVVVRLSTGLEIAFPPHLVQGLEAARPSDLAVIQISPTGLGLHFPRLDADLYVPGLLDGVFGSEAWAADRAGRPAKRTSNLGTRSSHGLEPPRLGTATRR